MAVYPFLQKEFVDRNNQNNRQQQIEIIRKLRLGDSYQAFKERFMIEDKTQYEDEDLEKLYITYNFMDSVINKLIAYCPNLRNVKTRDNDKRKLIKKWLNEIDWGGIESEVYDGLEATGDVFLEIYFEDGNDTMPKFKVLDSKNMVRALLDSNNKYTQYIYKETVEDAIVSYTTGEITSDTARERIVIFEKGRKVILETAKDDDGKEKKTKDGNSEYIVTIINNRDSYKDEIPLVHFKGKKSQGQEFSDIPATSYTDNCLHLDQVVSDIRQTNRMLGYPFVMVIDGMPLKGHKRSPAGIMGIATNPLLLGDKQAQVKDIQIGNGLNSMFEEFKVTRDDLYDKVGLITPTLREKLNVDSSRVVQQLNLPSENKIEMYVDSIIKAMQLPFRILLKENGLYNEEEDMFLSFTKPEFMIKSSKFDELLYKQAELRGQLKSQKELFIEDMSTDEEIELRLNEIKATEVELEGLDERVIDSVSSTQGLDARLIKGE